jgi:precorrin-2 dehydrogenase/sirohydrochlorin ferrochelatase
MDAFPAFFPLRGARVVIAGEGDPAEAKARLFGGSPAEVVRLNGVEALEPDAYRGADLIFVASFDAAFRAAAAGAARVAGAPLNVVDAPELSDFHTPAIVDRGQIVAAIGTAGSSPLMASLIRSDLEALLPEGAGAIAALLGARRAAVRQAYPDLARRRAFLRKVLAGPAAVAAAAGDTAAALEALDRAIAGGDVAAGRVVLLAAPAAPDLISLRAARVLAVADVILAAGAADALLIHHGRRDAQRLDAAFGTAAFLGSAAREGKIVAVVGVALDEAILGPLRARGVPVETLGAASAS